MITAAPDRRSLHSLLLGLAGRVSDEDLAEMRMCLADGEEVEIVSRLAVVIGTGRLALTEAEAGLVRALFAGYGADPDPIDLASRIENPPPPRDRFDTPERAEDAVDGVIAEAGRRVGGLSAIWRACRQADDGGTRRVYLAEARPEADVVELVAEMQHALTEADGDTARVEVFAERTAPLPYHDAALASAALVWAAEETPIRLARAFDGAHPEDGPFFHPDHERLNGPDGERVLSYLRAGELVLNTPGAMDDVLDTERPGAVPLGFRSDGSWVWPDSLAYYLKRYRLAPEGELVAHALSAPKPSVPLTRLIRHRALETLFAPAGMEPVWQAG
ncbi:hypothetical protein [Actinoallomurus sp. CA-142502]|uniref:hypothetical protein n=1 Tax=Actinoallomurus sp. CA-142502 TaxID=3239885 RepID=UPI003D8ECAD3